VTNKHQFSRAQFLRLSAVAAASTVVAACSSTATTTSATQSASSTVAATTAAASTAASAAAASTSAASTQATSAASTAAQATIANVTAAATGIGKYQEAPMLAAMVKAGSLPPVEQRLPAVPYVVPHPWLTTGKYGGQIQTVCSDKSDWGTTHDLQESMYGHSILRWLRDGLAIGPGLAQSWESNADLSTWTLHFRTGLKWSDGQPWSTADIMFWWNDEVGNADLKIVPPDEAHSGKGTLMKMTAPDANTIVMAFDAPTPLTADRLAMWVKRGIGPIWMDPAHYMKQFHIKYNTKLDPKTWVANFTAKQDFTMTPGSPTMTGWMLKTYNKGQNSVWTRNPYYWCVDKAGNQLPYLDGVTITNFQDPQVMRLNITQGKADYVHGGFTPLTLADVSILKQAQPQSNVAVDLWDGGDGTGSAWFFNYDYYEPKMRALIRTPKFLQALSHAANRANIQKVVYFDTGELTTGTMSPKALEFHIDKGPQVYAGWRDSYLKYDPELAKQMLDSIGVKMNGQYRTMPDGSPLTITLDYAADQDPNGSHVRKDELLVKDWQAIGLNAKLNPLTPASVAQQWAAGKVLTNADWGVGDGPNCLVYPQWLVPMENSRWAPLEGTFYSLLGTNQENVGVNASDPYQSTPPRMPAEKGGPIEQIWNLYNQTKVEPDQLKRSQLVWQIIKIHQTSGPFFSGTVANTPTLILVKEGLKNVPSRADLGPKNGYQNGFTGPWIIPSPAVYDPETYYWDNPSQHTS
jgi:peptide/nickel transport system substrate-binding protein